MGKALRLSQLREGNVNDTVYKTVENAYGDADVTLGTLSSADMLTWLRVNEHPERSKFSGLYLMVACIVDPETKERYPRGEEFEGLDKVVADFSTKDTLRNNKLITLAKDINGLLTKPTVAQSVAEAVVEAKKD